MSPNALPVVGVPEVGDAAGERRRFEQSQPRQLEPVRKQATAAALNHRIDQQAVFIDESGFDQCMAESDAAGENNVLTLLLLQRPNVWHWITG
jgi:hypothetical protein